MVRSIACCSCRSFLSFSSSSERSSEIVLSRDSSVVNKVGRPHVEYVFLFGVVAAGGTFKFEVAGFDSIGEGILELLSCHCGEAHPPECLVGYAGLAAFYE